MNRPVVALESSVIAQGLPHPRNLEAARLMAAAVETGGARPLVTGFVAGEPVAGLDADTIERFAADSGVIKAGLAQLPAVLAGGLDAATTVATAAWMADRMRIPVVATGGIGGVHRRAGDGPSSDVSGDLHALATLPVTVVCSGPKAILDLKATRERLESTGVTVVGFRTDRMPAFWFADSGLPVDVRCDTALEVARIIRARDGLGLGRAVLVCVPVPERSAVDRRVVENALVSAIEEAEDAGLQSGRVTPFLLARLQDVAGGALLDANLALLERNAGLAAHIAVALQGLEEGGTRA